MSQSSGEKTAKYRAKKSQDNHHVSLWVPNSIWRRVEARALLRNESPTEFINDAVKWYLRACEEGTPVRDELVERVNQLQDVTASVVAKMDALETTVVSGFGTLLTLTRGNSEYLNDIEDDNES